MRRSSPFCTTAYVGTVSVVDFNRSYLNKLWLEIASPQHGSAAAQLLMVAEKLKASLQPGSPAEILLYRTHQQLQVLHFNSEKG